MKWVLTLLGSLFYIFNLTAADPVFMPPPNPTPPPFSTEDPTLLPIVLTNNSLLDDNEVYFVITGSTLPGDLPEITPVFIEFDDQGVGKIVYAQNAKNAAFVSRRLSEFPTYPGAEPGARVCYIPYINSALCYFSLKRPLNIPVNDQGQVVAPSPSSPSDPNYNVKYQTFEFVYLNTAPQIFANLTAIAYFSLPVYAFISTPDAQPNTGLYQPRNYIMTQLEKAFALTTEPERSQWFGLFLRRPNIKNIEPQPPGKIIRILGTGQGMTVAPPPLFDPNYLDNAGLYGYSYIADIWSGTMSFYRSNPLLLQIPQAAGGNPSSGELYTGVINADNTITFTSSPSGYTVNFAAPITTPPPAPAAPFTTTENIFEGQPLWTTFSTGIYTDDPQQLSKLFEEAIIAGLIPTTNIVSNDYFTTQTANYYTVNPNLSPAGQTSGPWYDLYSKILHSFGQIYTFSFDEPLWPDVQISSQIFTPGLTYLGLTLCPLIDAESTTVLSFSPPSPVTGDLITFTATVTGNPIVGDPIGNVVFTIDGQAQTPVLLVNDEATFSTSSLSAGSHVVTATYVGTPAVYLPSTDTVNVTVSNGTQLTSTASLTSSQNPALLGASIDLTATISGTGGVPTGTVTFTINNVAQPPINLVNGEAVLTTAALVAGINQISASYSGSVTYLPSVSSVLRQVILDPVKLTSVTALTSSQNPARQGDSVDLNVTVSGPGPVPTGTVTLTIDGEAQTPLLLINGQATFSTSTLSPGIHVISADYSGSAIYTVSTSADLRQVVVDLSKLESTISIVSSQNPARAGDPVNLTAKVSGVGVGPAPTGSVTFIIDGSSQIPIALVDGQAVFSTSSLTPGIHNITANYSGSIVYASSATPTLKQAIIDPLKLDSTTLISSSQNPANVGTMVNFTATVTGSGPIPAGTVTFTIDGTAQTPISLVAGQAVFSTSSLAAGTHLITVDYSGSAIYSVSTSPTLSQVISDPAKLPSTTTITSSRNPARLGQPVTFKAVVEGTGPVPTGSVTFTIDGSPQTPVDLVNGEATLATSALSSGIHYIIANYTGSATYSSSSSPTLRQAIVNPSKLNSAISITSSQNPARLGGSIDLTALVTGTMAGPVPTGTVTFSIDGVQQAPTNLVNGQAVLTTSSLQVGLHIITADYSGSPIYSVSTSPNFNQIIFNPQQRASFITISTSQNPARFGNPVTFTAEVVNANNQPLSGKVTFFLNDIAQPSVQLVNGEAIFTTSNFVKGLNLIQANYEGNQVYFGSTSNIINELVFSPQQWATSTTLTSSPNPAFPNTPIVFTATVESNSTNEVPKGDVVFLINGNRVAQVMLKDGKATYEVATLSTGRYEVIAIYKGNRVYRSSESNTLIQYVTIIFPPRDGEGLQIENKFVTQTDVINKISWKAPLIGPKPIAYKIYKDSDLNHLIETIKVSHSSSQIEFEFTEHNRKEGRVYTYYIVAIDSNGNISPPLEVEVGKNSSS